MGKFSVRRFCETCGTELWFDIERKRRVCMNCADKPRTNAYNHNTGHEKKKQAAESEAGNG